MTNNFIEFLYSRFLLSDGVSIDTRTIQKDNLFFALKGPNFDANQYAAKALEMGAAYAVIDDPAFLTDNRMILAENSEQALRDLAAFHRSRFKRPVIGITGSNGKTTTKELINRVLAKKYITHATIGNLNNHLGVPLTILQIHPQVEVAIIEMGANHVGEIAFLSEIARPTHALITNIGEAHTETFGGIEGVLRGKSELFDFLRKTNGTALINQEDFRLANMSKRFASPVNYPQEDLILLSANPYLEISLAGEISQTNLIGRYNFPNIAAAVAVGRQFGVADHLIMEAIVSYVPSNLRSQVIQANGFQIISDCYNANPTSMRAALENLKQMTGRKAVILGAMKEVENSATKHLELVSWVKETGVEKAVFIGKELEEAAAEFDGALWFESAEKSKPFIQQQPWGQMTVLVKGSRSNKLDLLVEELKSL